MHATEESRYFPRANGTRFLAECIYPLSFPSCLPKRKEKKKKKKKEKGEKILY
jgi:hypothetical protein